MTLLAATCLLAAAPAIAATNGSVVRYRCTLIDGSVQVVAQDLSVTFPGTVRQCALVGAAPLAPFTPREGLLAHIVPVAPAATSPAAGEAEAGWNARLPADIQAMINRACRLHGMSPALVQALMYVESRFHPEARSPKGAIGLMQLMPATAARYGVASPQYLLDPNVNVDVGVRYLRDLQDRFKDRVDLILAAYNAGEGAVAQYGNRVPPYPETQAYVAKIIALLRTTPSTS